ncbi:MAG: sensor histidine kinase [Oscillospiraceae bacterium]
MAAVNFLLCLAASFGLPPKMIIPIASILLVLSALLAYIMAKGIVAPFNRIDLENPEDEHSYPEILPLTNRLSHQNVLISRQMDELRRQQREFRAITDNMAEGFVLIDTNGNILSYNSSAQRLMGSVPSSGLSGSGFFRESAELALKGQHNERIVKLDGRVYQILANPVEVGGEISGAVMVCLDITEKAQREAMRHDFSSNVSHELKTPLTSIYGISEIMMNGIVKPDDVASFAKSIHDESGRLITLINDIIRLSQLDDGSFTIDKEEVDLYYLAEEVVKRLSIVAAERGIKISLDGEPVKVRGIQAILDEMIYNICDNAIKYNVENGSVNVTVAVRSGHPVVSVTDTGIGIPREHIDRVFERFYRVDKSHSKAIGGTGLGLSIVKHAAAYHGADIAIKSDPGKGTTVTVTF